MIPTIIALAIISGFSIIVFRVVISHFPFYISGVWKQIIISSGMGAGLWLLLTLLYHANTSFSKIDWWDILCGILFLLSAFWCNYWVSNLANGFRMQMQINLVDQPVPVSLEEWMAAFGGWGMDAFLDDRFKSILIPWKIIAIENGKAHLLPGWGMFFGRMMNLIKIILPNMRAF